MWLMVIYICPTCWPIFILAAYKISNVFRKLADMDESIVFLFIGCRGCLVLDKEKKTRLTVWAGPLFLEGIPPSPYDRRPLT